MQKEQVYDELFEIYGTQDTKIAPVKFEDLQRMIYLECVIKETLRLFPVAPIIARCLTEDLNIGSFININTGCPVTSEPFPRKRVERVKTN